MAVIFAAMAAAFARAESFESLPPGIITAASSSVGSWAAAQGDARIQDGHGKSGKQSLRISGEGERSAILTLASPAAKGSMLSFHAERWTRQKPFSFRIDVKEKGEWREILNADALVEVGKFPSQIRLPLHAGSRELRFRCTAPAEGGVLLDDMLLHQPGPARAVSVETVQPVCPAFIREDFNPVLGFRVVVEGSEGTVKLEALELGFGGTTRMNDIDSFRVVTGSADPAAEPGDTVAEGVKAAEKVFLSMKHELSAGEHWFWVSPVLKDSASLDGRIDACIFRVKAGAKVIEPSIASPQRVGYAVRLPGDDGSKSYRIPGLVRTKSGSLIGVYDIRYNHAGDLPADIDVGVSRSTDSGQSWEPMRVAVDMGDDPKHGHDGVGDPAILVDPKNGRIWIAARGAAPARG